MASLTGCTLCKTASSMEQKIDKIIKMCRKAELMFAEGNCEQELKKIRNVILILEQYVKHIEMEFKTN